MLYFVLTLAELAGILFLAANVESNPAETDSGQCPDGWELFGEKCFAFFADDRDWQGSRDYCTGLGGDLAVLESQDEVGYVVGKMRPHLHDGNTFLRCRDVATEGHWVCEGYDPSTTYYQQESLSGHWTAGTSFVVNGGTGENCMEMWISATTSYLNDLSCAGPETLVSCQRKLDSGQCPDGWELFGEKCFAFLKENRDWQGSRDYCTGLGGDLAVLESQAEADYLEGKMRAYDGNIFLGCRDVATEGHWVCEGYDPSTTYYEYAGSSSGHWTAGSPFSATGGTGENCMEVRLGPTTSYMNDLSCDDIATFVSCQRKPVDDSHAAVVSHHGLFATHFEPGHCFVDRVVAQFTARGALVCAIRCLRAQWCASFNVIRQDGAQTPSHVTCQLSDAPAAQMSSLREVAGCTTYNGQLND